MLPVSSITLDGSESSDDLAIESWEWTREPGTEFIDILSFILSAILPFIHSFIYPPNLSFILSSQIRQLERKCTFT